MVVSLRSWIDAMPATVAVIAVSGDVIAEVEMSVNSLVADVESEVLRSLCPDGRHYRMTLLYGQASLDRSWNAPVAL